ncbi:MAG: leucine-rich repeat domain-containing protein [Flavobacteriaceae bacterium]|nr:leucine-rich repeat domain-containing protein [Flavobacteriaceae bacterium]
MKKTLLILIALCTATIGYSQTFTALDNNNNTLEYNITSANTVEVKDYISGGSDIDIPATVDNTVSSVTTTYNVTGIGNHAFNQNGLTSVVIPTSVTSIGASAFYLNTNLASAPLHNGIISIGVNAFHNCALTSVVIPTSMTTIEQGTFSYNNITSLTILNNITSIGNWPFRDNDITTLSIPNSVTNIGTNAFAYNNISSLSISNSISSIANGTFDGNNLTSITIPNNVTSIGNNAFKGNQLTDITIASSVTTIGDGAFINNPLTCIVSEATTPPTVTTGPLDSFGNRSNIDLSIPTGTAAAYATATWTDFKSVAEGLSGTFVVGNITYQINANPNNEVTVTDYNTAGGTVVNIPATVTSGCTDFSVTHINDFAFENKNLTSLLLPDSIIDIGQGAFLINNLLTVTIPDNVITINDGAFANNNLMNVVIGSSVTTIGEYAFRFNNLASLTIPDNVISIEALAFNSNSLTNLQLGNGLEVIGNEAFRFNNALQSVVIPASVTNIGDSAFLIAALTDVTSLATTAPTITTGTNDTFGTRSTIHLHIPGGTMGAYVTDSGALWTGFNPVTLDALGVFDFELANDITILITTDAINITHSNSIRLENYTIYSISGAKVTTGTESNIDTNYLSSGIYILKLDFDKGTVIKKFVAN